jgi:hypothetical protein
VLGGDWCYPVTGAPADGGHFRYGSRLGENSDVVFESRISISISEIRKPAALTTSVRKAQPQPGGIDWIWSRLGCLPGSQIHCVNSFTGNRVQLAGKPQFVPGQADVGIRLIPLIVWDEGALKSPDEGLVRLVD